LTNVETGERETIKVYPNPAKDYIYVDIDATNFDKGEIELFDMQGKLVKRAKLNAKQGNRVDVSNLNAGAYTYNVSLNGKTISGKIIVGK
ncbi:MAG: T9SS type A sorting domain-containing protein, partial [Bacteroidales bacterium]|nr:T9SS type A sorting domain-containing protein [Bacteroidales bacterium]